MAVDDADVVRQALSGDREAFRVLVERYHHQVRRLIRSLVGARPEVDDLSQEAFFRVYRHLDRCSCGSFGPYLLKAAYHLAVDHLRRRREWPVEDQKLIALVGAVDGNSEEELICRQRIGSLQEQVAQLPAPYRAVIELYYGQELSVTQVAAITEQPQTVVKNRLYRARQMLRTALVKEGW